MSIYFISDLHLTPKRPATTELFFDFLRNVAPAANSVYILGDLFEFWVGDDADEFTGQDVVCKALRRLTDSGVAVYFMHGNRDFLVGDSFADKTGCEILSDPTSITLHDQNILLAHGDSMCTDDTAHQHFRSVVNDPAWQQEFLSHSMAERVDIALNARSHSELHKSMTSMEIMDVNQDSVERQIKQYGADILVHGHTHRPGIHPIRINCGEATRIVLGDWYEQSSVLHYDRGTFQLSASGIKFAPVELAPVR